MPKVGMEPIRRKQIIESVLKCVARDGVEHVTLDKTAKKAGVSKGVVAYYFENKESLLLQSFQSFLQDYLAFPDTGEADPMEPLNARDFLLNMGRYVLGINSANALLSREESEKITIQMYSKMTNSEEYKAMINAIYSEYLEQIIRILQYGVSTGELQIQDAESLGVQILAMLDGLIMFSNMSFKGSVHEQFSRYRDFILSL